MLAIDSDVRNYALHGRGENEQEHVPAQVPHASPLIMLSIFTDGTSTKSCVLLVSTYRFNSNIKSEAVIVYHVLVFIYDFRFTQIVVVIVAGLGLLSTMYVCVYAYISALKNKNRRMYYHQTWQVDST